MCIRDRLKTLGRDIKRAGFTFANTAPLHSWQHPRNTASVTCGGKTLGWLCTVHPSVLGKLDKKAAVAVAQLDMDEFAAIPAADPVYREPSKFPGIDIDLSVVLPEGKKFADLEPAWTGMQQDLLAGVSLIDSFELAGARSVTLRFAFSSQEKTLSKDEVQPYVDKIVESWKSLGVILRG